MSESILCGICLNCDKNILSLETALFNNFFLPFCTNDIPKMIWLCMWCRNAVRNASKLIKLAKTSQGILASNKQTRTNYKSSKTNTGPYTLSYYSNNHIDIPPYIKECCAQNAIDETKSVEEINYPVDEENKTGLIEETILDESRDGNRKCNRKRRKRIYKTLAVYCKSDEIIKNEDKIDNTISTLNKSKNENYNPYCLQKSNMIIDESTDSKIIKKETLEIDESTILNTEHILSDENELSESNIGKKNRTIDYKEMNFEVKFLNSKEQLDEIDEIKKMEKYKSMRYQCEDCGKGFLTKDIFGEHRRRHNKSAGEYKCATCNLRFKSQEVLSQHMLAHKRRFACILCSAVFKRWSYCIEHRYKCGTLQSPAVCGQCKKLFRDPHSLEVHVRSVHNKSKKYICDQCNKCFATKYRLTSHIRTHTGDRPFSCDLCERMFASNSNLRAHKSVHALDKKHYCVECNTYYKTRKSLKSHLINSVKHRPKDLMFPCTECDKQFSTEKMLQSHINTTHMNADTVYNCTFCTKTFSNNSNLNKHIRHIHGTSDR